MEDVLFETLSSLTLINYYAFRDCSSLSQIIIIPSSVTNVECCAFYDCQSLSQIAISYSTFGRCEGLKKNINSIIN